MPPPRYSQENSSDHVAKFFSKFFIYVAENQISFAINIQGMTKRPFAERSRSEHKTAGPIFHSLKIYFQKESFMTENVEPKIRIHGFSVPAKNFAGKILAFLYRHIRVANFFFKIFYLHCRKQKNFPNKYMQERIGFPARRIFYDRKHQKNKIMGRADFRR